MEAIANSITALHREANRLLMESDRLNDAAQVLLKSADALSKMIDYHQAKTERHPDGALVEMGALKFIENGPPSPLFSELEIRPRVYAGLKFSNKPRKNPNGVGRVFQDLVLTKFVDTNVAFCLTLAKEEMSKIGYPEFHASTFYNVVREFKEAQYRVLKKGDGTRGKGEPEYLIYTKTEQQETK